MTILLYFCKKSIKNGKNFLVYMRIRGKESKIN